MLAARRIRRLGMEFYASHVCAILDDDTARCWGDDVYDQLGLGPGDTTWGDDPGEVPGALPSLALPPVRSIVAHQVDTCALAGPDDDTLGVYCWGINRHGQLGLGDTRQRSEPPGSPIDLGGARARDLALGITNVCAVLDSGRLRCWGGNRNYQLGSGGPRGGHVGDGVGDGEHGQLPDEPGLDVGGLEGFELAAVRMNGGWACVLSVQGEVRCWGGNDYGTLGLRHDRIPGCELVSNGIGCLLPQPTLALDFGELGGARIVDLQMGRLWGCVLMGRS